MRIVATADTHMPKRVKTLPYALQAMLEKADQIIHAGDITKSDILDMLAAFAPVTAVAGNADDAALREMLVERRILRAGRFRIGVCHGHGTRGKTLERALDAFNGQHVDAVVFGHSHIQYLGIHDGVLALNPGSPTDKRLSPYYSYGMIEAGETLSARIVYFDEYGHIIASSCYPDIYACCEPCMFCVTEAVRSGVWGYCLAMPL